MISSIVTRSTYCVGRDHEARQHEENGQSYYTSPFFDCPIDVAAVSGVVIVGAAVDVSASVCSAAISCFQ